MAEQDWLENVKEMWRVLSISRLPRQNPAIDALIDNLREIFGNVLFGSFQIHCTHPTYRHYAQTDFNSIDFFRGFVLRPEFRTAMPELGECSVGPYKWRPASESSLILDGILAELMISGGPYHSFNGSHKSAKQLGADFCAAMFDDRYQDVHIYHSNQAWSPWFLDVAWDHTIIGIDAANEALWMLSVTSTD